MDINIQLVIYGYVCTTMYVIYSASCPFENFF